MTDNPRLRTGSVDKHRSRRQVVTAAGGALGAVAVGSVLKAAPARATQGSPVLEGQDNTGATSRTGVYTTGNSEFGILADPNTSGKGSLGVFGFGGNAGVLGQSIDGYGVRGEGGTGVLGLGAFGVSGSGTVGVSGFTSSATGVGVMAETVGGSSSAALKCRGPAVFDRTGLVSITFPHSSATVAVPGELSASALVLALLQNAVTGVFVTSAVPDTTIRKVTIHLNKAPGSASRRKTAHVAWFVIN